MELVKEINLISNEKLLVKLDLKDFYKTKEFCCIYKYDNGTPKYLPEFYREYYKWHPYEFELAKDVNDYSRAFEEDINRIELNIFKQTCKTLFIKYNKINEDGYFYYKTDEVIKEISKIFNKIIFQKLRNLLNQRPYPMKIWSNLVKSRDNYICQKCGSEKNLVAHHIKPWAENKDLRYNIENGITLCKECHLKEHNKN